MSDKDDKFDIELDANGNIKAPSWSTDHIRKLIENALNDVPRIPDDPEEWSRSPYAKRVNVHRRDYPYGYGGRRVSYRDIFGVDPYPSINLCSTEGNVYIEPGGGHSYSIGAEALLHTIAESVLKGEPQYRLQVRGNEFLRLVHFAAETDTLIGYFIEGRPQIHWTTHSLARNHEFLCTLGVIRPNPNVAEARLRNIPYNF